MDDTLMKSASRQLTYSKFATTAFGLLKLEQRRIGVFIVLSLLLGITEGLTISLLVPILTASGTNTGGGKVLSSVSSLFDGLEPAKRIQTAALAMLGVLLARGVVQFGVNFLSNYIPCLFERTLAVKVYEAMNNVELSFIHSNDDGILLNGLTNWIMRSVDVVISVVTMIWTSILLIVYIILMIYISWKMSLWAFVLMLFLSIIIRYITSKSLVKAGAGLDHIIGRTNQVILESLNGVKLIRMHAAETAMQKKFNGMYDDYIHRRKPWYALLVAPGTIMNLGTGFFICLALFVSQMGGQAPDIAVSKTILFLFILSRINAPVTQLNDARAKIVASLPFFNNLETLLSNMKLYRQPTGTVVAGPLKSGITIEDLSFEYNEGRKVIDAVSLFIHKGEKIALVGASGAGKSTLVNLLTRLYEPSGGRILVDGVALSELDVQSWRRRIGMVSQDTFLFNDTIANNIAFGITEVDLEQIKQAAQQAAAAEFIEALPEGYQTVLGDRGVRLSGGQQQRLSIARAFLTNPDLIILDEATSHLDTYSERAVQESVENLAHDRTVVIVAHRLSTVRKADRVVVLAHGRIAEIGRHDELMARKGQYWDMVTHQQLDLIDLG